MVCLLEVDGLRAGYERPVVGPLTFEIRPGEVLGLWGANGSGKSTLLNAIARGARIFSGEIRRAPGLTLAYQEQRPVRLDAMPLTGRDLLRAAGADGDQAPPTLAPLLRQRIDRLSGGQYQLLCAWCALSASADLVLLDEPTNNLDPETESLLARALASHPLASQGGRRAVLVVSHEAAFLQAACSRVIPLDDTQPAPSGLDREPHHA